MWCLPPPTVEGGDYAESLLRIGVGARPIAMGGAFIALADLDKEDGSFHPEDTEGIFHLGFKRNELQIILEKYGFGGIRFLTAHTVNKEEKKYPIFLVTATKN